MAARSGSYPSTITVVSSSAGVGGARAVVEEAELPNNAPSSRTATNDSRPSGELVRIATRPLTMPYISEAASPRLKMTSLRAKVREVDTARRPSSVSGGIAPSSWEVSRTRRFSIMVERA